MIDPNRAPPSVVFGVIWYRVLATRELDDRLADELVTLLAGK